MWYPASVSVCNGSHRYSSQVLWKVGVELLANVTVEELCSLQHGSEQLTYPYSHPSVYDAERMVLWLTRE